MHSWSLSFLLGIVSLQLFSYLPSQSWIAILPITGLSLHFYFPKIKHLTRLLLACAFGFSWALAFAHYQSSWSLPPAIEGKTIAITGDIASIPNDTPQGTSFLFFLKKIDAQRLSAKLRLNWKNPPQHLHAGDRWQLYVRLKKIHGMLNPGGFDYEAFAFQDGLRASGYIINREQNHFLSHAWYRYPLTQLRESLDKKISENVPKTLTSPWITALIIGERRNINSSDWEILRNTGTNHLMAIAGLHIGFIAALMHFLAARCWRFFPRFMLIIPAQHIGAIAALSIALIYSAMAGFSLPTQRACIMLTVFLLTTLFQRNLASWNAWCCALLVVLLLNPLSVLTQSFWLSFGSVALIIYGMSGRLSPRGWWWKWGRIQWVIAVGLIPLSIALFQQCSLIAFVANSIAIPWVGWIVVPLCLFGCLILLFSAKLGGMILAFADIILRGLWYILTWFSHLPHVVWYQNIPHLWIIISAIIGIVLFLLPAGMPGRYLSIVWLLPLVFFKPPSLKPQEVNMTMLDIGQGLSTVIQTQHHLLVFDAGARFGTNYDMGESVVAPYLHSIGAKKIDMLVVSHGDNDHIGGAPAIIKQFPVLAIKTSVPEKLPHASYCLQGMSWQWDGVDFQFLYPTLNDLQLNNNSSCVLRVTDRNQTILLTGDIEKLAEKNLVATIPEKLSATILIAPHHGSKTSADEDFVHQVNPQYVLFSTGYRNRYHFPHQTVVETYQKMHVAMYNTVDTGAIQFLLNNHTTLPPSLYRLHYKHYWNS